MKQLIEIIVLASYYRFIYIYISSYYIYIIYIYLYIYIYIYISSYYLSSIDRSIGIDKLVLLSANSIIITRSSIIFAKVPVTR